MSEQVGQKARAGTPAAPERGEHTIEKAGRLVMALVVSMCAFVALLLWNRASVPVTAARVLYYLLGGLFVGFIYFAYDYTFNRNRVERVLNEVQERRERERAAAPDAERRDADAAFYERAAGALGGVAVGAIILRDEHYGLPMADVLNETHAAGYVEFTDPADMIWDVMAVETNERLDVLSGCCASVLARFDVGMMAELARRVREDDRCRENYFRMYWNLVPAAAKECDRWLD